MRAVVLHRVPREPVGKRRLAPIAKVVERAARRRGANGERKWNRGPSREAGRLTAQAK